MLTDWQELSLARTAASAVVDPRRRLRCCLAAFLLLLLVVWCRAAQLEISQGAAFRAEALRPIRRQRPLEASRGRILARDGAVLASDRRVAALTVEYRYLEEPPRPAWLEQMARKRLPKDQRRNAARLASEVQTLREELKDLHRRLAALAGVDLAQWQARARRIQGRVETIAAARRRQLEAVPPPPATSDDASWASRVTTALHTIFAPSRDTAPEVMTVAEELSGHVLAEDVPAAAVAEIGQHPERYPGVQIVYLTRRGYPCGTLAAHLLGYLGPPANDHGAGQNVGRTGIEQQCEARLRGQPGMAVEVTDRAGRVQQTVEEVKPASGRDVTLTIDSGLQRLAEELLDGALNRVALQSDRPGPSGGAAVVIDVRNGEILAAASAPRFDPAAFEGEEPSRREALLADPAHPLFHRAVQMALPPGSVFKVVTAVALLESGGLDAAAPFYCQGYLKKPDRQRCAIYVRHGMGHGDVTLTDALAESCNVYFFHHAEKLPPQALVDWAERLGFGQKTGVDLPGEARGTLPAPESIQRLEGHAWHTADTQAMAVGQGSLTATPLQVARMICAVANGGLLVTPHFVREEMDVQADHVTISQPSGNKPAPPVPGLSYPSLTAIRAGLRAAVADKEGTAHGVLDLEETTIAGKTGTAEIGEGRADHAWFAGYVPADHPRYAMVVVLERGGNAATAACPVARRLVLRMLETGLLKDERYLPSSRAAP